MLHLMETKKDKTAAQNRFSSIMRDVWNSRERRLVVWRPNSRELPILHNDNFWFAHVKPHDDQETPRYWNSFGSYNAAGNLQIAVEINIPTDNNTRRVSGFFAKDEQTDSIYLMHDGAVGGGRSGIGQEGFLAYTSKQPVPVMTSEGNYRFGIIVTELDKKNMSRNVSSFIRAVVEFKEAVARGDKIATRKEYEGPSYADYFREFSGKKKGIRKKEFEYITRHGDIVHALTEWALASYPHHNLKIVKNPYIDLGAADKNGKLVDLYEVKTSSARQNLYTAIGQLLVHQSRSRTNINKYIVLPKGEPIPKDVDSALAEIGIYKIFYELQEDTVLIRE